METKETLEMRDEEAVRAAASRAMRSMSPMAMLGRRGFLMGMGALGLAGITGCAPQATPSDSAPMAETGEAATAPASTEVTADTIKYEPIKTEMTLEELNERRQQLIDSKTEDYVCADGTVIPNVYVKLRSLLDTYGNGVGSQVHDGSYAEVMYLFTPEDAQAYLEMPMGVMFTAADYAAASGRAEDECAQICEDLSARGLLFRSRSNGTPEYHQLAEAHGIWEYNMNNYEKDDGAYPAIHNSQWGADIILQLYNARSSFYNAVPCSREVVADNEIALPYDDFEAIVDKFDKIAVSPCQCRLSHKALGIPDPGDHPLETCITLGEEAEYYIENGIGREIDKKEALEILHRSVDCGMVIQVANSATTEVICSCHGDCCDILGSYVKIAQGGAEPLTPEDLNVFKYLSHYTLKHDEESCIKCGSCEKQCPLFAITMDEETGFPTVNGTCVRCGQCGTVCPVGARTLHLKEEVLELPETLLDDYNAKGMYRFANDMIA